MQSQFSIQTRLVSFVAFTLRVAWSHTPRTHTHTHIDTDTLTQLSYSIFSFMHDLCAIVRRAGVASASATSPAPVSPPLASGVAAPCGRTHTRPMPKSVGNAHTKPLPRPRHPLAAVGGGEEAGAAGAGRSSSSSSYRTHLRELFSILFMSKHSHYCPPLWHL